MGIDERGPIILDTGRLDYECPNDVRAVAYHRDGNVGAVLFLAGPDPRGAVHAIYKLYERSGTIWQEVAGFRRHWFDSDQSGLTREPGVEVLGWAGTERGGRQVVIVPGRASRGITSIALDEPTGQHAARVFDDGVFVVVSERERSEMPPTIWGLGGERWQEMPREL